MYGALVVAGIVAVLAVVLVLKSVHLIGAAEVGLVNKRVGLRKLHDDNPIAFRGEAGYQAQRQAIGELPTALVAMTNAVAEGQIDVMPEVLVTGGGSSIDGLAASLMRMLNGASNGSDGSNGSHDSSPVAEVEGGDLGSGDAAVGVGEDADPAS